MMKILVLSDSHGALNFMRRCISAVKPDAVIHLGDFYEDGQTMAEEFPHIPFHQVPGNCDTYRMLRPVPEILNYDVCGVRLLMTHGHKHGVKSGLLRLYYDAKQAGVQAVVYGHTHIPHCEQDDDGMWIMNPGSSGTYGGGAGLIYVEDGKIMKCVLLDPTDLEEFK